MLATTFEDGEKDGKRRMIRVLLQDKFGTLNEATLNQLNSLSGERLEALAIALLKAKSLQELGLQE
jgi:hypothetical protein